jgi:hypothetical protein
MYACMHVHIKLYIQMCICIYTYIYVYRVVCVLRLHVCICGDLEATEELTASETRAPSGRTVPMSDMPSIAAPPAALCQQMERKREGGERGGEEGRKMRGGEGDACVDA